VWLAVENLRRRAEQERDELVRVQIFGALAVADSDDPRWLAKLSECAASSNHELMEAAELALIHLGK